MSTTTLFGSTEAQAARDLIGGTAIGDLRNDLLKQILVATANRTGGSGGSGTVTSVSVTTQNGVSATVTNPTTTPALAFTLGAITPTTVQLSGSVSGTTLLQSPAIAGSAVITFPSVTGTLAITSNTVSQFAAGGTLSSLTGFSLRDTSAAFDVTLGFTSSPALTAGRALTFDLSNVAHTIALGTTAGTITFPNAAAVTVAGLQIANVFTAAQTINAGTLTTAALTLSQTWNNAGVTCRGLEVAVTNTNSAADSTIFRILGGAAGTSQLFNIDKNGWVNGPTGATMVIAPAGGQNMNLYVTGGGNITCNAPLDAQAGISMADNRNITFATTNGTIIGTATNQKMGFWNATPVVRPAHIADPAGGAVVDAEARTAINAILAWQATLGLTAAA
jgi:hypothetical protein